MAELSSLQAGRFKRLARRSTEVWQVGAARLPMWIANQDDAALPPTRGFGVICRSVRTGLIHVGMPDSRDPETVADCAVTTCLEFGLKWQRQLEGRPAAIHVSERWLLEALTLRRDQLDADIVLVSHLPELAEVLREMEADTRGLSLPNLLDDGAMSRNRIRAFADAAAQFYRAAPWQWLDNEDLIVIEQPKVPKSLSCISVLGAGGQQFGLGFFENVAAFDRVANHPERMPDRAFSVTFGPIDEMPFGDVDLWEADQLPLAGADAYPLAAELRARGQMRRPTPAELTGMEGLLRALAKVTEPDLDAGRWAVDVEACDGPVRFVLSLPDVVDALESPADTPSELGDTAELQKRIAAFFTKRQFASPAAANKALQKAMAAGTFSLDSGREPLTPSEQAQRLAGRAFEAGGRVRVALARRALALDPDSSDAWLALVDAAPSADEAVGRARHAVDAGRRTLGEAVFSEAAGSFWLVFETRPYMRAMAALAQALREASDENAAIEVWQEMLRLNPGDNQGMRYVLLFALLSQRRHEAIEALLQRYPGDIDAAWRFARTLWMFSRDGATLEAASLLAEAHKSNHHVLPLLTGHRTMPVRLPDRFQFGSPDEAALAAAALLPAIDQIEGCADWIMAQASVLRPKPVQRMRRGPASPRRRR